MGHNCYQTHVVWDRLNKVCVSYNNLMFHGIPLNKPHCQSIAVQGQLTVFGVMHHQGLLEFWKYKT